MPFFLTNAHRRLQQKCFTSTLIRIKFRHKVGGTNNVFSPYFENMGLEWRVICFDFKEDIVQLVSHR